MITIKGIAYNAKAGALVASTNDNKAYYIDGLDYWDDNLVEKTIIVTGELKIEESKRENARNEKGELRQTGISTKYIIVSAKWKV